MWNHKKKGTKYVKSICNRLWTLCPAKWLKLFLATYITKTNQLILLPSWRWCCYPFNLTTFLAIIHLRKKELMPSMLWHSNQESVKTPLIWKLLRRNPPGHWVFQWTKILYQDKLKHIALFGLHFPRAKECYKSSVVITKKISHWNPNFPNLHLTHEIFRILSV